MNFYQAPITRYLRTDNPTSAQTFADITVSPQVFGTTSPVINSSTWKSGNAINVFFETPGWPSSTFSVNLEYNATTASTPLLVAPNVMMVDADYNCFIRGNSTIANVASAGNTRICVMYSATLSDIKPVGARASASNSAWVQPADQIDISGNGQTHTNLSVEDGYTSCTVQACRMKHGADTFLVEFNAPIRTDGAEQSFPISSSASGGDVAAYELALKYLNNTFKGIAKDSLTLNVVGRATDSSAVFTATMSYIVNISYPVNNKTGLISGFFDPSRFIQVSKAWATTNMRPFGASSSALFTNRLTVDKDQMAGAEPYRCLSIIDPGASTFQIAVTINPIS